jgi:hypothetical protein
MGTEIVARVPVQRRSVEENVPPKMQEVQG